MTTTLPDMPIELDPAYVAPEETIEEAILPRQPRAGEWVQLFRPEPNGDNGVRRGQDGPHIGQVLEVREGDYTNGGCLVRIWRQSRMAFDAPEFAPWCCIFARTKVNAYSLTGR